MVRPSHPVRLRPDLPNPDPNANRSSGLVGIGQFTILDPNQVTGADLGNNFFLESDSLGKPRAEEVVKYLAELNSDVHGHALVKVSQVEYIIVSLSRRDAVGSGRCQRAKRSPLMASQSLATVVSDSAETLAEFSLIIAVDVDPNHLLTLSDLAWEHEIPLIKVKSCGFFGSVRTQLNELASTSPLAGRGGLRSSQRQD